MKRNTNIEDDVCTDADRRLTLANRALFERLQRHLRGKTMSPSLYSSTVDLVRDHRFECVRRDIDYPQVVVVWLDEVRAIKIVRADVSRRDMEVHIVNWTREHPDVTRDEIVRALTRHFPGYVERVSTEAAAA